MSSGLPVSPQAAASRWAWRCRTLPASARLAWRAWKSAGAALCPLYVRSLSALCPHSVPPRSLLHVRSVSPRCPLPVRSRSPPEPALCPLRVRAVSAPVAPEPALHPAFACVCARSASAPHRCYVGSISSSRRDHAEIMVGPRRDHAVTQCECLGRNFYF